MKQRSKNYNIILNGVPEMPEENTSEIILGIAKNLGSNIAAHYIDTSHRLNKSLNSKNPHRPIVVRPKDARTKFMVAQKSKSLFSDEKGIKYHIRSQIFLNDHSRPKQ